MKSTQKIAETSLVSDFQLLPGGSCVAPEGDRFIVSRFSLPRTIYLRGLPDGPRTDDLRNLFAVATDEVQRICAVMICSPVTENYKALPHYELQCYSAASSYKFDDSPGVGRQAHYCEMVLNPFRYLPKGCFPADAQLSHNLKNGGYQGHSPGGAFAYFSRRGEK